MAFNKVFDNQSTSLKSYNYVEFTTGVGIVDFYLYATQENATPSYHISSNTNRTEPNTVSRASVGTTTTNFDASPFVEPTRIEGVANVSFSRTAETGGGSTSSVSYMHVYIIHYDGTTETTLGDERTDTITSTAGTPTHETNSLSITCTKKDFKIGDILRIKVNLVMTTAVTASCNYAIDPYNEDVGGLVAADHTTIFKCAIPFKILE